MFGPLGVPELLLIFVVILIVFGPRRIPEIGRMLGKAMGEFRKATDDLKNTIEREVRLEELKSIAPSALDFTRPFEAVSRTEPSVVPAAGGNASEPLASGPELSEDAAPSPTAIESSSGPVDEEKPLVDASIIPDVQGQAYPALPLEDSTTRRLEPDVQGQAYPVLPLEDSTTRRLDDSEIGKLGRSANARVNEATAQKTTDDPEPA